MSADNTWDSSLADRLWVTRYSNPTLLEKCLNHAPDTPEGVVLTSFRQWKQGHFDKVMAELPSLIELPDVLPTWRSRACNVLAAVLNEIGLCREAQHVNSQERAIARQHRDVAAEIRASQDASAIQTTQNPQLGIERFGALVARIDDELGSIPASDRQEVLTVQATALFNMACCYVEAEHALDTALAALQRCEEIAKSVWPHLASAARAQRVSFLLDEGRDHEARAVADGLAHPREIDNVSLMPSVASAWAQLSVMQGEPQQAIDLLTSLIETSAPLFQDELYTYLINAYEASGQLQEALAAAREQRRIHETLDADRAQSIKVAVEIWYRTREAEEDAERAQQEALALATTLEEFKVAHNEVMELNSRDGLTGLHNRTYLWDEGAKMLAAATAHRPAQVALLDLDGFKAVNDSKGHLTGDSVLREFATMLQGVAGSRDLVARHGGDEFVVIRPPGVWGLLEDDLGALTGGGALEPRLSELGIGVSIGMLTTCQSDITEAFHRVDMLMYEAKSAGGGRIVADVSFSERSVSGEPRTIDVRDASGRAACSQAPDDTAERR